MEKRTSSHQQDKVPGSAKIRQQNSKSRTVRPRSITDESEIAKKQSEVFPKKKSSLITDADTKFARGKTSNTRTRVTNAPRKSISSEKQELPKASNGCVKYTKSKLTKQTSLGTCTSSSLKISRSTPNLKDDVFDETTKSALPSQSISDEYLNELSEIIKREMTGYCKNFTQLSWAGFQPNNMSEMNFSKCLQRLVRNSNGEFVRQSTLLEDIPIRNSEWKNNEIAPRMLLEGPPGFGKTTLACQLGLDWCEGKQYLSSFRFVFVIQLRHLKDSIENFLSSILINTMTAQIWQRILKRIQHETLLILDGYDEMNKISKHYLIPILQGNKYPKITVLVTSRPDVGLLKNYFLEHYSGLNWSIPWEKILLLTGVDDEFQKEFLEKNLKSKTQTNFIRNKIADEINEDMKEVYKSPLFLKLLAVLISNHKMEFVRSKTVLYTNAVNAVIKQSLSEAKLIENDSEVDIFSKEENKPFYIPLLLQLGKLSLRALREKTFYFNKAEIMKCCKNDERVFKLGLLTESVVMFYKQENEGCYEPIHKSFLEFLSVYYLASTLAESNYQEGKFVKIVHLMMEEEVKPMTGSLVYQFLGGILGEKVGILFQALSPWSFRYYITKYREYFYHNYHYFYPILNILSELTVTDDILVTLLPFIPVKWEVKKHKDKSKFFVSSLHARLLSLGTQKEKIQWFCWHLDQEIILPETFFVRKMELDVWKDFHECTGILKKSIISCEELTCKFIMGFEGKYWKSFVQLLSYIRWQQLNIVMNSDVANIVMPYLHQEFTNGKWMTKSINRLCCELGEKLNLKPLNLIEDLIAKDRIVGGLQIKLVWASEGLGNNVMKESDIELLFLTSARSVLLKEFSFVILSSDLQIVVDVNSFSHNYKEWKYLTFHNNVDYKIDLKHRRNILVEEIELDRLQDVGKELSILKLCRTIKRMKCTNELFKTLTTKMPTQWSGFDTITELNLKLVDESYEPGQFNGLIMMKNLSTLSLDLYWVKYNDDDDEDGDKDGDTFGNRISLNTSDAEILLTVLPKLPLKTLEFNDVGGWNIPFVKHIAEGLCPKIKSESKCPKANVQVKTLNRGRKNDQITTNKNKPIHLDVFKIQFHDMINDDMKEFIEIFKKLLKTNTVKKIHFLDPDESQIKLISNSFCFREGYNIDFGVEGLCPGDTLKSQKEFSYNSVAVGSLIVTR